MEQQSIINYSEAIKAIKSAILQSRYRAAALANIFPKIAAKVLGEQMPSKPYRLNYNRNCLD